MSKNRANYLSASYLSLANVKDSKYSDQNEEKSPKKKCCTTLCVRKALLPFAAFYDFVDQTYDSGYTIATLCTNFIFNDAIIEIGGISLGISENGFITGAALAWIMGLAEAKQHWNDNWHHIHEDEDLEKTSDNVSENSYHSEDADRLSDVTSEDCNSDVTVVPIQTSLQIHLSDHPAEIDPENPSLAKTPETVSLTSSEKISAFLHYGSDVLAGSSRWLFAANLFGLQKFSPIPKVASICGILTWSGLGNLPGFFNGLSSSRQERIYAQKKEAESVRKLDH